MEPAPLTPAPAPVLIVEDEQAVAHALARLVRLRTEAVIAGSIAEAQGILLTHDLAAAIVDVKLPDGSGLDAVRHIRHKRPLLPVLVLTALDEKEIANRAQVLRAEFAYKPAQRDNVLPFVERALAARDGFERAVATAIDELERVCDLSQRERAIASMAVSGLRSTHMVVALGIGRNSLKTLIRRLLNKTGDADLDELRAGILTRAHATVPKRIGEFGPISPRGVIARRSKDTEE